MTDRIHWTGPQGLLACLLFALALAACGAEEEETTEPPADESASADVEEEPAEPAPEPFEPPPGWQELEVQVEGQAVTMLVPTEEQRVDVAERRTSIYGSLPGQSYPYWFSIKHQEEEAPTLRDVTSRRGLEQEDTDFGFRAEKRDEDGNGWTYVVYADDSKLSCYVSLSSGNGVTDELVEEARRPCDYLAAR